MVEIYKEQIHDLLNPNSTNLQIKEDLNRGIFIKDLTEYSVVSEDELLEIIAIGESVRTVAATKMNKQSSRSH
jgi:kinesin family protein 15